MSETLVINIGLVETLAIIATVGGSLISVAWVSSGRFARVETLVETIDKRLTNLEGNFTGAFIQQSPIALTEKGKRLLMESGLGDYIDDVKGELIRLIQDDIDITETAYDVQELAFDFFDNVRFDYQFEKTLKQYAYESGVSLQLLRRVAGIYFRDILLKHKNLETV